MPIKKLWHILWQIMEKMAQKYESGLFFRLILLNMNFTVADI
jgi:hypothetical protein